MHPKALNHYGPPLKQQLFIFMIIIRLQLSSSREQCHDKCSEFSYRCVCGHTSLLRVYKKNLTLLSSQGSCRVLLLFRFLQYITTAQWLSWETTQSIIYLYNRQCSHMNYLLCRGFVGLRLKQTFWTSPWLETVIYSLQCRCLRHCSVRISLTRGLAFQTAYKITTLRNWRESEFGLNPNELQWWVSQQSLCWGVSTVKTIFN